MVDLKKLNNLFVDYDSVYLKKVEKDNAEFIKKLNNTKSQKTSTNYCDILREKFISDYKYIMSLSKSALSYVSGIYRKDSKKRSPLINLEGLQSKACALISKGLVIKNIPSGPIEAKVECYEFDSTNIINSWVILINKFISDYELLKNCTLEEADTILYDMYSITYTLNEIVDYDAYQKGKNVASRFTKYFKESYNEDSFKKEISEGVTKQIDEAEQNALESKKIEKYPNYELIRKMVDELSNLAIEPQDLMLSINKIGVSDIPNKIYLGSTKLDYPETLPNYLMKYFNFNLNDILGDRFFFNFDTAHSSLVIDATNDQINSKEFEDILALTFMQFLASFPLKYLNIMGMRNKSGSLVEQLVGQVATCLGESIVLGGVKNDPDKIKAGIEMASNIMTTRVQGYGRLYTDIFDYNLKANDTKQPFVLLFINDYPNGFEDKVSRDKLRELMINGGKCGILTIMVNNSDLKIEKYGDVIKPFDCANTNATHLVYKGKNSFLLDDGTIININPACKDFLESDFWNILKDSTKYVSKPIMLDSIVNLNYSKPEYYDVIKIPVGKIGNDLAYFTLDVEGTGKASAIIAGGTGSGKTSFLHTIILSGAMNYSPDELEFYLIDFKDGVEFTPYKSKENGINIPHVSFLSLKNKVDDAYDLLMKISNLKAYRNKLFNEAGVTDFKSYHKSQKVLSNELPKLRRTIVIIDEYQNLLEPAFSNSSLMSNRCAGMLLALLKEIRNVGISIILCSQSISVGRESLDQIYNRYIFSSTANVLQKAFSNGNPDQMSEELQRERGLCYLTNNGGATSVIFKSAWSGKTNGQEQQKMAEIIRSKYSNDKEELVISGNEEQLEISMGISDYALAKPILKNVEKYDFYLPIGQSFLSNEPISLHLTDSEFSNYLVFGDLGKARQIEFSMGLSFLYEMKKDDTYVLTNKVISYLDLNLSAEGARKPSPYMLFENELHDFVNYITEEDEVTAKINEVYDLFTQRRNARKSRMRVDLTPQMLIINTASELANIKSNDAPSSGGFFDDVLTQSSSNSDVVQKVKELYERGYEQQIFICLSDKDAKRLKEILGNIKYETAIYCSADDLKSADFSSTKESISITNLADNCVVVLPNVSKVRPYNYRNCEDFIAKFVEVIK